MDIWITLRVTHIPTKSTATADSTSHYLSTHYQLCVFMYSSAANLKNADKLKP